jgi:hypothetical protein
MHCGPVGTLGMTRFHQGVVTIFMAYLAVVQMRLQSCFLLERLQSASSLCLSLVMLFRCIGCCEWESCHVVPKFHPPACIFLCWWKCCKSCQTFPQNARALSRIYSPDEVFDGEKLSVFFKQQFFNLISSLKAINTNNLCIPCVPLLVFLPLGCLSRKLKVCFVSLLIYTTCQEYLESVKSKLVEPPSESSSDVTWQHLAAAALLCTEGVFPWSYW